ncbi:MAG: hypothetical protein C5B59_15870 [Bacteroidetes bacterium]|nr:MAG: hypothetical protein C5B59_15870 [Bacteroidota bacterium]
MKLKLILRLIAITAGLLFAVTLVPACKKSNRQSADSSATIATILKKSPNSTYFYSAIAGAGLNNKFNGGHYTVFVPTDSAYGAAGITKNILNVWTDSALKRLVLYQTAFSTDC